MFGLRRYRHKVKMPSEQYKTLCLYYTPFGAPSRHVLLATKVLGIDLNLIVVDLPKGEHMKRQFLQINPEHKVPVIVDNGFVISESRAIMTYLTEKYGKNESLYPRDIKIRAKINQFLYFDIDKLLGPLISYYVPIFFGAKNFDSTKMPDIEKAFTYLNAILEEKDYVVGDKLTLADLALVSSVATAVLGIDFKIKSYPNVEKWYVNLKTTLPGFKEIIEDNTKQLKQMLDMMKNKKN